MATSGSFNGNSVTYGCYMFINWQLASQEIDNNRSLINWQAYFHFQGSDTQLDNGAVWSNVGTHWSNGGRVYNYAGNFSTRNLGLASGSFWINHNSVGNADLQFGLGITTQFSPARSEGTSGVWSLPTIPRQANFTSVPNFNDEQSPTIYYSNPAGNAVSSLDVSIHNITGSTAIVGYRAVSKTGSSYTFNFTSPERDALRAFIPNNNSVVVRVYIRTVIGGNTFYDYAERTLSIVNGNPVFTTATYKDSNSTTSTITGNDQYLIQGYSTLEAKILTGDKATAIKQATMSKYNFAIGSINVDETYTTSTITKNLGTLGISASADLIIKAIDSRTNFTSVALPVNVLPYTPPAIVATATRVNNFETETDFHIEATISRLTISGTDKNTVNTTSGVRYRYKKTTDVSWGSWVNKTSSTSAGAVSVTDFSLLTALDRNFAWNIQVEVTDKLATSTADLLLSVGIPVFRIGLDGKVYNNEIELATVDEVADQIGTRRQQFIRAYHSGRPSYSYGGSYAIQAIDLSTSQNGADVGSLLSFNSTTDRIIVGTGVSKVRVSAVATSFGAPTTGEIDALIRKNTTSIQTGFGSRVTGQGLLQYAFPPMEVDVVSGDYFQLAFNSGSSGTFTWISDNGGGLWLQVEVIE